MTIYKALHQFQFKLTSSVSVSNTHLSTYKMMAMLVYLCSILVSTTTMFGDPINCMVQDPVPEKMFTSYCYMESSYSYARVQALGFKLLPPSEKINNLLKY
jgi:hypothetical protein